MVFSGSCHCGRIHVEFAAGQNVAAVTPRACQCGFCQRHGAAYVSDPGGTITLTTSGAAEDTYRFGLGITDFHVCRDCGVLVAATWQDGSEGSVYGVVNSRVLDLSAVEVTEPVKTNFDGESVTDREARRRANWTPVALQHG